MRKMIIDIYPPVTRPEVRPASFAWFGARSLALILFVILSAVSINAVGNTAAYYFDTETSRDNFFAAASLDFTVETEKSDNRLQTFTQGGWGSTAHGDNPGAYRDANFASAFPNGVTIGETGGYTALFTDSEAVEVFLPAGSTPGPFTQDHINSTTTEAGILAGQTLALTLNVGFDLYDPDFAPSVNNLKNYIIHDATVSCDGLTVQEVLNEANNILGGLGGVITPSQINECATWINEKFDEGGEDGLAPGGSISQFATILNGGSLDFQYMVQTEKTGGEDDFCQALDLEALLEGTTSYTGKLMDFVSLPRLYSTSTADWEFVISLPIDANEGGSCSFDFIFSGWQTTLPEFGGFSDIERVDDPVHSIVHSVASVTVESEVASEESLAASAVPLMITEEESATTTITVIEATSTPAVIEEATSTEASSTPIVIEESTSTPLVIEVPTSTPIVIEETAVEEAASPPPVIEEVPPPVPVSEPEPPVVSEPVTSEPEVAPASPPPIN